MLSKFTATRAMVALVTWGGTLGGVAAAADADSDQQADQPRQSSDSVAAGAFLPWTAAARGDTQRALGFMTGGYDSARHGSLFQAAAEVQVFDRLSLRGGSTYLGTAGNINGKLQPDFAIKVDALRQERHGVDLAVAVGYEAQGFNTTPAITARVAASRAFGRTRLISNVAYGIGTEEGERFGDVRLAGLHQLSRGLSVGLDSRFRVDLERDAVEPVGEPEWELDAGPVASYSLGRFVVSASGGATALKYRLIEGQHLGVLGLLGAGAVF